MDLPQVGLYLRLSRDDENGGQESMSIANQRAFLLDYAAGRGWEVSQVYTDDGYTGTNFERPGFKQLLADIEGKKINTVITKDLSRLGRDQIGTLYYYQIYFPSQGVRYIAVNEGVDTGGRGGNDIALPFLAAANDFYTADISRKVRTALETRRQSGQFIGARAPLGYGKDPACRGHLIPEPETAEIVREIFRDYLQHGSVHGTALRLSEGGVPPPSAWQKGQVKTRFPGLWSDTMVRRILTNPTYAGHLTQGRTRKVGYKVSRRRTIPREEWLVIPDTHEALVTQTDFDRVQELLKTRSYTPRTGTGEGHLLTGLAFCADCGSPMTYMLEGGKRSYMVCQGYRRSGRLRLCTPHSAREDFVIESIRRELQTLAGDVDDVEMGALPPRGGGQRRRARQRAALEKQWEGCSLVAESLYEDRATGLITPEEFAALFARNREKKADVERRLAICRLDGDEGVDEGAWQERLQALLGFETLERTTLVALVERVLIHENKEVELWFRFQNPSSECKK